MWQLTEAALVIYLASFFNISSMFYEKQQACVVQCSVKMTENAKNEIEDNVSGNTHISLHIFIYFY